MTIRELLAKASSELQKSGQILDQAWLEAESLLAKVTSHDKAWLISHGPDKASSALKTKTQNLLKRRIKGEPLAYLLGSAVFCGQEFLVNRHTLIPRPETEELVTRVAADVKTVSKKTLIWDVGVGSGAIAISLARLSHQPIIASDRSKGALTVARQNAKTLIKNKNQQPTFFQGSLLASNILKAIDKAKPDLLVVVANLPYLPRSDKKSMSPSVVKYEPGTALFANKDGLDLNQRLMQQLKRWQKKTKQEIWVYIEFDPPQASILKKFAQTLFPSSEIKIFQDFCGKDRFLSLKNLL